MALPIIPLLGIATKVLDKLFPDPVQRAEAEAKLQQLQLQGDLKEIEVKLTAILAEANSQDKWTSRARPGFLYVVYIYILAALPMGVIGVFFPTEVSGVILGVEQWLAAIPGEMWGLFGAGYLGYVGARTYEKRKIIGG